MKLNANHFNRRNGMGMGSFGEMGNVIAVTHQGYNTIYEEGFGADGCLDGTQNDGNMGLDLDKLWVNMRDSVTSAATGAAIKTAMDDQEFMRRTREQVWQEALRRYWVYGLIGVVGVTGLVVYLIARRK